jgi:Tfp pilus assembly protein PilF
LIRASDGFRLWSETYDRRLESIFAIQDEISGHIASALEVSLGLDTASPATSGATTNPEVYDLYLRARALHRQRGKGLSEALDLFERALAIDPEFAPAWAGLAHTLNVIPAYASQQEMERIGDARAQSMSAAQKALTLDPDLTTALHAMANNLLAQFEWSEAQAYYERALMQDPESTDIMEDYGHFLLYAWQTEKARQVADQMIDLDPFVPVFRFLAMRVYEVLGETEQQDEHIAVAMDINPGLTNIQYRKLLRLLEQGRGKDAHAFVDQMNLLDWTTPGGMHRLVDWTFNTELPLDAEMSAALEFFPAFALAGGQYELWLDGIQRDISLHWENLLVRVSVFSSVANEEQFRELHALAMTKELIQKARLPEYWRETGWPERCRPLGENDFECR